MCMEQMGYNGIKKNTIPGQNTYVPPELMSYLAKESKISPRPDNENEDIFYSFI